MLLSTFEETKQMFENCSFSFVFFKSKQKGDTNEFALTIWRRKSVENTKLKCHLSNRSVVFHWAKS